eukprot:797826-Rhodomonas_salina.1
MWEGEERGRAVTGCGERQFVEEVVTRGRGRGSRENGSGDAREWAQGGGDGEAMMMRQLFT